MKRREYQAKLLRKTYDALVDEHDCPKDEFPVTMLKSYAEWMRSGRILTSGQESALHSIAQKAGVYVGERPQPLENCVKMKRVDLAEVFEAFAESEIPF